MKPLEIIIVDDGSQDKTKNIVREFAKRNKKISLFEGEHKGPGFSRNLGAKYAKGEILIFIDADMTFDKNYIKNIVSPIIKDKEIIGTTHDYEVVTNLDNIWSRCWGSVRVSKENAHEVKIFRAIQREKFLGFGGFDPKYGYADDQTFWFKYKIKPVVASDTKCYHKNPETLGGVYRQSIWIGSSIDHPVLSLSFVKYLIPPLLFVLSPTIIPILAIKKSIKNKDLKILVPWMILFMSARYLGTIRGIARRTYFEKNFR
jgi:glycosyltransferase involved in cell wall biosynthesis